jgi:hypothetical protein
MYSLVLPAWSRRHRLPERADRFQVRGAGRQSLSKSLRTVQPRGHKLTSCLSFAYAFRWTADIFERVRALRRRFGERPSDVRAAASRRSRDL